MDVTGQMPNYDLYTELALDRDMPPTEIGQLLDDRISTLAGQGYQPNSPEIDQLATARAILSDPVKRDTYEAALTGPDGVIDVSWLHNLADAPSQTSAPRTAGPQGYAVPSYDAAATSVITAGAPAADTDGEAGGASDHSDADATSTGPSREAGAGDLYAPATASVSPFAAGAGSGAGQGFDPGNYGAPEPTAQGARDVTGGQESPLKAQFTDASLSVDGRTRSQSKVYLACLAVVVVGMLYPLLILLTAGRDDVDAVYSILKATLFVLAHTAAWLAIAEIVWGVRRIAVPGQDASQQGTTGTTRR